MGSTGRRTWKFWGAWGDTRTWYVALYYVFTSSQMSTPINYGWGPNNMHLHSLMVINYCCRVYKATSKCCRIMARRILNNKMSSMITSDPQSHVFWCYTYALHYCCRCGIVSPRISDALRSPIHIFVLESFLFTPQNWYFPMMPHWTWPSITRSQGWW